MSVPLLVAEHRWECPNCTLQERTFEPGPHTRFHTCKGLAGLTAPMIPAGTRAKVEAIEREDYVGGEHVTRDGDGRPVMAIETTRDDGNDRAVFAPVAVASGRAEEIG